MDYSISSRRQDLQFDHARKWYMHKPEFILENETQKFPCDFGIQTDHLIPTRRPDLKINNKKKKRTCNLIYFALRVVYKVKIFKKSEKLNKYLKVLFTNPSTRAGYDTRSIFKRSLTGLNSEFSFS